MDKYGYTKSNPPSTCIDCKWHGRTYSPSTHCHSYWYDLCKYINRYFAKMHIILRGEYRSLAKHDEGDLMTGVLPYECPYFDSSRIFWDMYGIIKMQVETFIFECATHYMDYKGWYVYSLKDNIDLLMREIPDFVDLHYIYVDQKDIAWFTSNYGDGVVLLSDTNPADYVYPVPPEPV